MIDETVLNKLETLSRAYNQCVTRPQHGNYYENTLIHIGIEPVLASWDENKGQPFIEWVRDIDCKLRETIEAFDWEKVLSYNNQIGKEIIKIPFPVQI